ncbi:MAG: hypothetical protein HGA96_16620 [Desulfobulbaceae bacterium]|nr:hypothetical protein [Desulfobulbaceae bacterium]
MKVRIKQAKQTVLISQKVLHSFQEHIGNHPAERGGMLGRDTDGVIRHFEPDHNGRCTSSAYDPDIAHLNAVIRSWKKQGIEFCGFGHSHPSGFCRLSAYDKWYAGEILAAFKKLDFLVLPIIQTVPDTGNFEIMPFIAVPDSTDRKKCKIAEAQFLVENNYDYSDYKEIRRLRKAENQPAQDEGLKNFTTPSRYFGNFEYLGREFAEPLNPLPPVTAEAIRNAWELHLDSVSQRDKYLVRLGKGVDKNLLDRTRVVVVGTGGSASLIRNCARMGFGEFVLIDPDVASDTNIATQQVNPDAIGLAKVEILGRDIVTLNPAAAVLAITKKVEQIDDFHFRDLFHKPLRCGQVSHGVPVREAPRQTILMVLTDNFWAQARGHRLGLHFGLPTICAQEYLEGRGAEITYTVPGVTPACHRCITASRYRAYIDENYLNDVTSVGAPIFAAELLNAALGHTLLMVAHHGTDHQRWGNLIERLGNRNLIRLRMDPDFDSIFGNTFSKRLDGAKDETGFFMLDSLFLAQTPDYGQTETRPVCPDCGGTGDLRDSIGKYQDTRAMSHPRNCANRDESIVQLSPRQVTASYYRGALTGRRT